MGRGGSFSFFLPFFFFSFAPIHLLSLVERKGVRGDFAPACERDLCPLYFFSSLSPSLRPFPIVSSLRTRVSPLPLLKGRYRCSGFPRPIAHRG